MIGYIGNGDPSEGGDSSIYNYYKDTETGVYSCWGEYSDGATVLLANYNSYQDCLRAFDARVQDFDIKYNPNDPFYDPGSQWGDWYGE